MSKAQKEQVKRRLLEAGFTQAEALEILAEQNKKRTF
jgi:SOS response regulatory protein OraA/RecX